MFATLALYQLKRQNVLTPDPDDPTRRFNIQTGEQESKGVEVELTGQITSNWNTSINYTATDAFVSKDNRLLVGSKKYRRGFVERTNDAAEKLAHGTGWELQVGREFWESVPPFQYDLPDWKWTVRQNRLSFAVLLVWLIGAALLAFFSISRTRAV